MSIFFRIACVGLVWLLTPHSFAATNITTVENIAYVEDEAVTVIVKGSELGNRPNVVYYNDFRKELQNSAVSNHGQLAGTTNLRTGKLPMVASFEDTPGFYIVDEANRHTTFLEAVFENQSKVFLSFSAGIPTGKYAPLMSEPGKWSDTSNWKMSWIMQSPKAYGLADEFDLCGPTIIGKYSALQGNASKFVTADKGYSHYFGRVADWWAFDTLNHMQIVFDGNLQDPHNSQGGFSVVNKERKYLNYPHDVTKTKYRGPAPSISQINFPGWYRAGTGDNFQALYSNIYVAGGDNYLRRIEITDSADYLLSSYRRTVFPREWSETEIRFDVYKSEIRSKGTLYLHYFNESGIRMDEAHKVCQDCPMPII